MNEKFDGLKVARKNSSKQDSFDNGNKKKIHQASSSEQKKNLFNRQDEMKEIDDKLKSLEMLIKNNLF